MNTQSMMFEWLARQLGLFSSTLPTTIAPAAAILVQNSVVNSVYGSGGVSVAGRFYYAVQSSGVAGGDQIAIETSLDGANWAPAPVVPSPIVANNVYQFTGIFNFIRARVTAGSGTATLITLMARS